MAVSCVRAERLSPEGTTTWTRLMISNQRLYSNGVFSNVYQAYLLQPVTGKVAIKKTWPASRSHVDNREITTLRYLNHPNIVRLLYYYSNSSTDQQTVVNLIFEFLPTTVHQEENKFYRDECLVPHYSLKLWTYQLFLAVAYIQSKGICHRDIKPQNMLLIPETGVVKLGDFGAAKYMLQNEPNTCYQVTRYYRAPELILGCKHYGVQVDTWAAACCFGQFLKGRILFCGINSSDQFLHIMKALGTPTCQEVWAMYADHPALTLPLYAPTTWNQLLAPDVTDSAIDLISRLLVYDPQQRLSALEACQHEYFDQLRNPVNGEPVPLTQEQLRPDFRTRRSRQLCRSISDVDIPNVQKTMRVYSR